jgi:putative PIN family toxin of toxin-antitoxin system
VRVFFDTNVLVSAFASRGLCNDLLRTVLADHDLVLSGRVVDEFERIIREKLRLGDEVIAGARAVLRQSELVSDSPTGPEEYVTDEADAMILAAAIHAEVDYFVTGDRELLSADQCAPVPVISPRRFMELLHKDESPYPPPSADPPTSQVSESSTSSVKEKSFKFGLKIIRLCRELESNREYVISRQLMRSGTSIGAQVEEAGAAESRKDFLHKMSIASKEARESNYWLRLLNESDIELGTDLAPYVDESLELVRLLTAIVKTTAYSTKR